MKTQFFKPNWHEINKAINNENLKDLREAQRELEKKIQGKIHAFLKAKREVEQIQKIAELKVLPKDAKIYFIGRFDKIKYGSECIKIADGRTRIHYEVNGKRWNSPYQNLSIKPPTEQEYKDRGLSIKLSRIFNKAINQ